ncbi:MAG: hypothetical protein E6Q27_09365 [Aeromicrobium sp.]|uniref:Addiction module component n=1 Tax=uncultured bacterium A1Q1_fos_1053 TaxID=1256539 RepID=L7VWY7_9BACT|nr:hypothetical protein [uncultured bacterium A1Q1_fos_1053]TXJ03896.1 MAG: hypothetical protein E6Q27_09365 [Aeromicrobium sp.]
MVSAEVLASVDAMTVDERFELIGYIEQSLEPELVPTAEQHGMIQGRLADMKVTRSLGLTLDEAKAAIRSSRL